MPIFVKGKIYNLYHFQDESEFEKLVDELSDSIFGNSTIYIAKKRRMKGSEIITIPDAYLIDMTIPTEPRLYIIENEIVSHDPFKHIGIQLLKFATSFDGGKVELRNYLMGEISENKIKLARLEEACSKSTHRNIDNYLDTAVYGDFKALVLIDEAREELHNVLRKINANISVLELKVYYHSDNDVIYHYDTLYDDEEEIDILDLTESKIKTRDKKYNYDNRIKRRQRRAECDTIVVPAREDGFQSVFINQNQWYSIRISAAMKERIKYIAAYQVAPVSAITHLAEVDSIIPYLNTGKYLVKFKSPAKQIRQIPFGSSSKKLQGPVYVKHDKLLTANSLDELLAY
jgi:hypothetical protein